MYLPHPLQFPLTPKRYAIIESAFAEVGLSFKIDDFETELGDPNSAFQWMCYTVKTFPYPAKGQTSLLRLSAYQLRLALTALRQTLKRMHASEFYVRTNVFKEDYEAFLPRLEALIAQAEAEEAACSPVEAWPDGDIPLAVDRLEMNSVKNALLELSFLSEIKNLDLTDAAYRQRTGFERDAVRTFTDCLFHVPNPESETTLTLP